MSYRLIAAVAWFSLGGGLLLWPYLHGGPPPFTIAGTGVSAGWLGVALGCYNLVAWYGYRQAAAARRAEQADFARREAMHERTPPPREPDPNFDFGDRPPGAAR